MNCKRGVVFFVLILVMLSVSVRADLDDFLDGFNDRLDQVEELEDKIGDGADFVTKGGLKSEGGKWKDKFLETQIVGGIDGGLQKFDWLSVLLFSRHYSFSLGMLLVVIFWVLIFLSLPGFMIHIKRVYRWILSFVIVLVLAHMHVLNLLTRGTLYMIYLKPYIWWNLIVFLVVMFVVVLYWSFSQKVKETLDVEEKEERDEKVESETDKNSRFRKIIIKKNKEYKARGY